MEHRIHFVRTTAAAYEELLEKHATDPDTLYFCVSGKGFALFLGDLPLEPHAT